MTQATFAPTDTRSTIDTPAGTPHTWLEALTLEERKGLLRLDPVRAWWSIAVNWMLVFAAMALVAWAWPNPWLLVPAVVVALCVIGGRQLGMAVIMHEASHRTMFANRRLNDWAGKWLAAYPVWTTLDSYRKQHLIHHTKTWTEEDPDLGLVLPFPVTKASLRRKFWRDISGQTAWKFIKFRMDRTFAEGSGTFTGKPQTMEIRRMFVGMVITNAVLAGLLTGAGYPALYLLWVGAYLTTHHLVIRIRSIAEHSMVDDPADPLRNSRTTEAGWITRLVLAPTYVNYHLEHHLMMTVPHYNLPRMHRLLRERGVVRESMVTPNYATVLRRAVAAPGA